MRAYVDEVAREVPDYLLKAPEEDASDDQLAKVKNDLSARGINESSNAPPPPPARTSSRQRSAGAASLKAFGDFDVNEIDDYHLTPLIHAVDAERRTPRGFCWMRARTSTGVTRTARRRSTMRLYWGRRPSDVARGPRRGSLAKGRRREYGRRRRAIRGTHGDCGVAAQRLLGTDDVS